jgi:1,6-anhydro-N-acetylmuramate kinase
MIRARPLAQTVTEIAVGAALIGAAAMTFRGDQIGVLLFAVLTVCMILLRAHPHVRGVDV